MVRVSVRNQQLHIDENEVMLCFQESPTTSDDVDKHDATSSSSSASTPMREGTYVPFQPLYAVTVTEPIKNGDLVQYTVKTVKLSDDTELTVTRQYDDFEYLHHCLQMQNPSDGIIVSVNSLSLKPMTDGR